MRKHSKKPIGVVEYKVLPPALQGAMPTVEQLQDEFSEKVIEPEMAGKRPKHRG